MQGDRERIVLATKYTGGMRGRDINATGNSRKNMMDSVHASLKRLQTDYIDLYWVHAWDPMTPTEELMRGMDDLVRFPHDMLGAQAEARGDRVMNHRSWSTGGYDRM